jgi:hypothetical protein
MDCVAAGRVFGARIDLPDWKNVLAVPGRQSAPSLDDELTEEMGRVTDSIFWNSAESGLDRSNNDLIVLQSQDAHHRGRSRQRSRRAVL